MLSVQVHLKQVLQGTQLLPLPPARLRCRAGSPLLHEGLHSSMCSSCVVELQAVCRDGTLTIFASCHTPVTPGCFPTDVAHHASGMSRWQGDSSCWGCGEEQLAAASALLPGGGCWLERWGAGAERCLQEGAGPPRSPSFKPICPCLSKVIVCMAAQGFDACRQMPGKFNPAGLGADRQGIATTTFNHLSKCQVSLKSSG